MNSIGDKTSQLKEQIRSKLRRAARVSFTTDGWKSTHANTHYISVTAHYITVDFKLERSLLSIVPLSITAVVAQAAAIKEVLADYNIDIYEMVKHRSPQ